MTRTPISIRDALLNKAEECAAPDPVEALSVTSSAEDYEEISRAQRSLSGDAGSSIAIPPLFRPRPRPGSLVALCQKASRSAWLDEQSETVLSQDELEAIWFMLKEESTDDGCDQEMLSYEGFCRVIGTFQDMFRDRPRCRTRIQHFMRASTYMRLAKDARGRISALSLFEYLMRKCFLLRLRIDLAREDTDGDGRLTEADLRRYLKRVLPQMRPLAPLLAPEDREGVTVEDMSHFTDTWLEMAVCKFSFYHGRQGRFHIKDLLTSHVMSELHLLRELTGTDDMSMRRLVENWFSVQKSRWLYSMFLELDADEDGLLSADDFARVPVCRLSPLFVARLFEEHATGQRRGKEGCHGAFMTFGDFLRFLTAWEGRMNPRPLAYFWPVLDLGCKGFLTQVDVYHLFKAVVDVIKESNPDAEYRAEDVKDEIFDMVKPRDGLRITLSDVLESKRGAVVVGILADANAFISYDMRENNIVADAADS